MTDAAPPVPTEGHSPLTCRACQAIDAVDGEADGVLFGHGKYHVANEKTVWQNVLQAQDRVADQVTSFAGSL
ncbi:MAG TPA: hypothetical protein VF320_06325, partial [Acidimicrobiales bacterium]